VSSADINHQPHVIETEDEKVAVAAKRPRMSTTSSQRVVSNVSQQSNADIDSTASTPMIAGHVATSVRFPGMINKHLRQLVSYFL